MRRAETGLYALGILLPLVALVPEVRRQLQEPSTLGSLNVILLVGILVFSVVGLVKLRLDR